MERTNAILLFEKSYRMLQCFSLTSRQERVLSKISNRVISTEDPFLEISKNCTTETILDDLCRLNLIIQSKAKECLQQ